MPKTVDDVLAEFEKKHDLKIGTPAKIHGLPTGNLGIDWMTGVGGLPVGRITELYGYEASGKTTTALQTAAALQQQIKESGSDQRIIYLDFEHALDVGYATALGIDFHDRSFVPIQPSNLEQGAKAALDLIETGTVPLVVFDSVAAMAPKRHKDGEFDQATVQMLRAKLISALCSSMVDMLWETNTTAVFVNHRMESIEMSGRPGLPPKTTTPGGRGLKYYASLRLEFDLSTGIKDQIDDVYGEQQNQVVGNKVFVRCVKNKVGVPGRTVELRNRYGHGFDNAWSALQVLVGRKLISKSGSWFNLFEDRTPELTGGEKKLVVQGEKDMLERADDSPVWRSALIRYAESALADEVTTA